MFQITKQSDYALRFLVELMKAEKAGPLSLKKFAEKQKISFLFMQKIVKKLREGGIVKSEQGTRGGYFLNESAGKITLKDIFEALEGPCSVIECANRPCPLAGQCSTKGALGKLNSKINKALEEIKLSDF